MRLGLKTHLTLWHGITVALILIVVAFVGDRVLSRVISAEVDSTLLALAETEAASALDDPEGRIHLHEVGADVRGLSFRRFDKLVQIVDADGRVLARSATLGASALPAPPALLSRLQEGEVVAETLSDFAGEPVRFVSLPIEVGGRFRYAIQVGTSLHAALAFRRAARFLFLGGSVAILCAVTIIGALLARGALRPIDQMVGMAHRIGESNLQERLPDPGTPDEVGRLAATLNEMLDRIERSFETQRRFTADASHELRSPLSRLRSELEVTLRRPRPISEYEAVLRSALDEVERLSRLTEQLLTLARLDAGETDRRLGAVVSLTALVEEELKRLEAEAERREVALDFRGYPGLSAKAAPEALRLAVANLLHNAVKFSPPDGRVTVTIFPQGNQAVLTVSDTGAGIPPEDLPRVFERFYRGRPSRAPDVPGVGLGLAIARAIVETQGGTIAVESTPGVGTTFTIRFALAA